jgi:hypothetical protein
MLLLAIETLISQLRIKPKRWRVKLGDFLIGTTGQVRVALIRCQPSVEFATLPILHACTHCTAVNGSVELEGRECFIASDITEIDSKYKQSQSDLLMAGDNPPPPMMT